MEASLGQGSIVVKTYEVFEDLIGLAQSMTMQISMYCRVSGKKVVESLSR